MGIGPLVWAVRKTRAHTFPKSSEGQSRKADVGRTSDRTKTDTGRRDEYSKALERTLVKELCNINP